MSDRTLLLISRWIALVALSLSVIAAFSGRFDVATYLAVIAVWLKVEYT
jgi:hypothetical protein